MAGRAVYLRTLRPVPSAGPHVIDHVQDGVYGHVATGGAFSPLSLFAASEQGVWYDPSDFASMFQDSAGTTPVTAVGQPVGLILDKRLGLALGPELVTNGDFSDGTTGFTAYSGSTMSVSGGALRCTRDATNGDSGIQFDVPGLIAGRTYWIEFDIVAFSGVSGANIAYLPPLDYNTTGLGHKKALFTFAGGSTNILCRTTGAGPAGSYVEYDNISVREIAGNHATQATAAARPVVSARVNLVEYSEDLTNGSEGAPPWYHRPNCIVTANQGTGAFADLDKIQNNVGGGVNAGLFCYAGNLASANRAFTAQVTLAAVSGTCDAVLYLGPFSGGDAGAFSTVSLTTTPQVFTLTHVFGAGAIGGPFFEINPATAGVPILAGRAQIERGSTATRYQRVTTASDYDSVGFPLYLSHDGIDDSLSTTFPDLGTDVTIARAVPMVGASILTGQTIGAGTWTDSTNHAGLVIIDRALTAGETAALTAYLNTKAGV